MFLKTLATSILITLLALPASATTVVIPNVFYPNTPAQSSQVNANFNALATAINGNIDNSNIGLAGIYASQLKPLTTAEATFGGTIAYTFPSGVINNGTLTQSGNATFTGTITESNSSGSPALITASAGGATGALTANGFAPTASGAFGSPASGYALGWNNSGGQGEMNFYDAFATGTGNGFSWLVENTTSAPYTQTTAMTLSRAGALATTGPISANGSVSGTIGTFSGALTAAGISSTGNISAPGTVTFTQLSATPGCVSVASTGVLSSTGASCGGTSATKYPVSVITSGSCAQYTSCILTSSQPSGMPASGAGVCYAMETGAGAAASATVEQLGSTGGFGYTISIFNTGGSAIASATTLNYTIACQ